MIKCYEFQVVLIVLTIVLGANDGVINHEERRANIYIIGFLVGTIKRRKDCKIFDEMDHFRKKQGWS